MRWNIPSADLVLFLFERSGRMGKVLIWFVIIISKEDLSFYQSQNEEKQAAIVKCYVKRYHRAKMSGLQKRYYAKLYRIGKLKKKPYSQVWKYRDDIRKMRFGSRK